MENKKHLLPPIIITALIILIGFISNLPSAKQINKAWFFEPYLYNYQEQEMAVQIGKKTTSPAEVRLAIDPIRNPDIEKNPLDVAYEIFSPKPELVFSLEQATDSTGNISETVKRPLNILEQYDQYVKSAFKGSTQSILTEQNQVHIIDIIPNVDLQYEVLPKKGIKELIIIKEQAPAYDTYEYSLEIPEGYTFYPAEIENKKIYLFINQNKDYIGHIAPLFAYDSAGNMTDSIDLDIQYTDETKNKAKLTIKMPIDWLKEETRTYPVYIDPTIVHDDSAEFDLGMYGRTVNNGSGSNPDISINTTGKNFHYGIFTSNVIDLGSADNTPDALSWSEFGISTNDGEIPISEDGLVAQWNFNETSGTTAYNNRGLCSSNCNASLTNFSANATSGQDNNLFSGWTKNYAQWPKTNPGAIKLDGIDDYISIPNNSYLRNIEDNDVLTLETWVLFNNKVGDQFRASRMDWLPILDKSGSWTWQINEEMHQMELVGGDAAVCSIPTSSQIKYGEWYHLAFAGDKGNNNYAFYINGEKICSGTDFDLPISRFDEPMFIGYNPFGYAEYADQIFDTLRIYNRRLSDAEILSNARQGNIQFQTRTGGDNTPDDGSWEEWKPSGNSIFSNIDPLDSNVNTWNWNNSSKDISRSKTNNTIIKTEGTGSMKLDIGNQPTNTQSNYSTITKNISSQNFSGKDKLVFDISSNQVGSLASVIYGESLYANHESDDYTLGLWKLEETSNNLYDDSTNNNNATSFGSSIVTGKYEKGRSVSGDNRISMNNGICPSNLTIEAWIKPNFGSSNIGSQQTTGTNKNYIVE